MKLVIIIVLIVVVVFIIVNRTRELDKLGGK